MPDLPDKCPVCGCAKFSDKRNMSPTQTRCFECGLLLNFYESEPEEQCENASDLAIARLKEIGAYKLTLDVYLAELEQAKEEVERHSS